MKASTLQEMAEKPLDALIVGGGVVGAGLLRESVLRHMHVGLVEQGDFASGTSSRTSRLLHGGLRYLSQGRLQLVRQASREKLLLRKLAPHLVQPTRFLFPSYHRSVFPLWKLRIGVHLYDALCKGENFTPSEYLDVEKTLQRFVYLDESRLAGAVEYADAQTLDFRLVIDTLLDARSEGALLRNYTRLESAEPKGNLWVCTVKDIDSGEVAEIQARCVFNATGPWASGFPQSKVRIRPTKGVHLVFRKEDLPLPSALVLSAEKRILFALPWGDRSVLGTTDTAYSGTLENPQVTQDDVDYLLRYANECLSGQRLHARQVLTGWAGIRPLVEGRGRSESEISRRHIIRTEGNGWWDVAGGKLTTYRLIAEETIDQALNFLGLRPRECQTQVRPLPFPAGNPAAEGIVPGPIQPEDVPYYCRREWVQHLDDVMLRRTGWGSYWPGTTEQIKAVAKRMADELQWSDDRLDAELQRYQTMTPSLFSA